MDDINIYVAIIGIREASLFMCQGGAAFSYGGAENWRRGLGGQKKVSSTFRGGKKKYVFLIINHNSTDIWWA